MKKPIYKKWWFWVIVVVLVIAIIPAEEEAEGSENPSDGETETTIEETTTEPSQKYMVRSVSELVADLEKNALNAKEQYDGEYVEITGRVDVIDASGNYISLYPTDNEWAFTGVQCFVDGKEQKEFIRNISAGDVVTLRGKITAVGEVLGYTLNIHEFVG